MAQGYSGIKTFWDFVSKWATYTTGLTPLCEKHWKLLNRISPKM